MQILTEIILKSLLAYVYVFGLGLMMFAAEARYPQPVQPTMHERLRIIKFLVFYLPLIACVSMPLSWGMYYTGYTRPFELEAWVGAIPAAILSLMAYDFVHYWLHRAQHKFPILWRFHSMHHSIEKMGMPTGYGHFSEPILRLLVSIAPLALIIPGADLGYLIIITGLQSQYLHSSTRLTLGVFTTVFVDSQFHRIHHSVDQEHRDTNFSTIFTIWDSMFGTAHWPERNEWPDIGLKDEPEPRTLGEFFLRPFRSPDEQRTTSPQR